MQQLIKTLRAAIICFAFMTILCGIIYPLVVTGIAAELFPNQANGSIITSKASGGAVTELGSKYLGQAFSKPEYLIGRPMGTTNLSPDSSKQKNLVEARINWWHTLDPTNKKEIPMDLVTASGSGVDPNISPNAAAYQVARIATARGIDKSTVEGIIAKCTSNRLLGVWGEPGVNVLEVNIMLDALSKR